MDKRTFDSFRELVYAKSGISLKPGKEALVSARVGKRMRVLGIGDHESYLEYVLSDESEQELVHLLDAISTNVTSFFREANHFEFVADAVTQWQRDGQRRFRFWSAAASTGEEPYTLAMTLTESLNGSGADARILATDISTRVLELCLRGEYDEDKLRTVPPKLRHKYIQMRKEPGGTKGLVSDALKKMIVFRRLNLSTPPFPMKGPLDIVMCRNVMIYFDNEVRSRLLAEINRLLKPGGYLIVGHAESLTGMMSSFRTVRPSIYVKS